MRLCGARDCIQQSLAGEGLAEGVAEPEAHHAGVLSQGHSEECHFKTFHVRS